MLRKHAKETYEEKQLEINLIRIHSGSSRRASEKSKTPLTEGIK